MRLWHFSPSVILHFAYLVSSPSVQANLASEALPHVPTENWPLSSLIPHNPSPIPLWWLLPSCRTFLEERQRVPPNIWDAYHVPNTAMSVLCKLALVVCIMLSPFNYKKIEGRNHLYFIAATLVTGSCRCPRMFINSNSTHKYLTTGWPVTTVKVSKWLRLH